MSLSQKSKTDALDAQFLAKIGLERKLDLSQPSSVQMREIRMLTREYREIKAKLVIAKNQLHAKKHGYQTPKRIIERLSEQIQLLEAHLGQIELELKSLVLQDKELNRKIEKIETIPGIGFMTIMSLIGETNGFILVSNAKQLVSYAGLDIQLDESGTKRGKSRISKKGNSYIRNALYMPALCATRHNEALKMFYTRLVKRKQHKKIGITAVARKLLILVYTLWKNDTTFDPAYQRI